MALRVDMLPEVPVFGGLFQRLCLYPELLKTPQSVCGLMQCTAWMLEALDKCQVLVAWQPV